MPTSTFAYRIGTDLEFKYRDSKIYLVTGLYYNNDLFKGRFEDTLITVSPPSKEPIEGDFRQSYSLIEVPIGLAINFETKKIIIKGDAGMLVGWSLGSSETFPVNNRIFKRTVRSKGLGDINNLRSYIGVGIGIPVKDRLYVLLQPNIMFNLSDALKRPVYASPSHSDNELFVNIRFGVFKTL
jgi:hypothetical protein